MRIKIYQINAEKDFDRVRFLSYELLPKLQTFDGINSKIYDAVYDGEVNCKDLEEVYRMFSLTRPKNFNGHSISVSDVIEVVNGDSSEFYYCNEVGFKKVDFDACLTTPYRPKTIRVVLVKPGEYAKEAEIDCSLKGLQSVVGGPIEAIYPFDEAVCLVCNEEGKLSGLPLNRALCDDDGSIVDIIAGTFFIADCSTERFGSLSDEQIETYKKLFYRPEVFIG